MALLFTLPRVSTIDLVGQVAPRATLQFFRTLTSDPQPVYADAALTTPLNQPVPASDAGLFPAIYLNEELPRYKAVCQDENGSELWTVDPYVTTTTPTQASIGASLYPRTALESSAGVTPINYARFPSPWKDISRFVSDNTGATDVTAQMQNAFAAEKNIVVPAGAFLITSPISLRAGVTVTGAGSPLAAITARGCNAFTVDGDFVVVEKIALFSQNSGGTADPRTHDGIKATGIDGAQRNSVIIRDMYMQGWLNAINWEYTWSSVIDAVRVVQSERCVRIFGECANNHISNSSLEANSGEASIITVINGVDRSEGLMVSNCLLATGEYGIKSDGFISMSVVGCILDLIGIKGMELTGVEGLFVDVPWIYAASSCIDFVDQGSPFAANSSIRVGKAWTHGTGGHAIRVGVNNNNVSISGSTVHLTDAASSNYPIAMLGTGSVTGVHILNSTSQKGILVSAADVQLSGNSGACTVNRTVSPNFTGTLTGCTTSPTGTINYEVVGEEVVLEVLTAIEGTSNDTAATITGLPAILWPARVQQVVARTKDNSALVSSAWQIGTGGVITLFASAASTTFTGSGTKGVPTQTLRYKRT
jgi:hypothetical protein